MHNKVKKIAIVAHGLSEGGAERIAVFLANKLFERGYEIKYIVVYSSNKGYYLNPGIQFADATAGNTSNKVLRYYRRARIVESEVRRFEADVVISFIIDEMLFLGIKKCVPIIYTLRMAPFINDQDIKKRILMHYLYARASKVVFQTSGAKNYFEDKIQSKGVVLGNPLPENLPYWNENHHYKRVVTACRLSPEKNLKMMIDGFSIFRNHHLDYTLEIYGAGEQEELQDYINEKELSDCVTLKGYSTNISEIMAESAVFVLTSNHEGLSNSMLEAMAIGVPLVCTDCPPGGNAEYITDSHNGFLVKVGDSTDFAYKLDQIVNDKELQHKFYTNEIKIRERLSSEAVISRWESIINGD